MSAELEREYTENVWPRGIRWAIWRCRPIIRPVCASRGARPAQDEIEITVHMDRNEGVHEGAQLPTLEVLP